MVSKKRQGAGRTLYVLLPKESSFVSPVGIRCLKNGLLDVHWAETRDISEDVRVGLRLLCNLLFGTITRNDRVGLVVSNWERNNRSGSR